MPKPKQSNRTRPASVMIRLTPEEKTELKQLADSAHTSVSNYLRMVAFNQKSNLMG